MKQKDLNDAWAWARIEAMADGSLDCAARLRMHEAMRRDTDLDLAVSRAAAVRRGLRSMGGPPVPGGLLGRLLAVPSARHGRSWSWSWAAVPASVAVAAVVAVMLYGPRSADEEARLAAVQEFNVAMYYLQKSVAIANRKVEDEVGTGVYGAIAAGRNRLTDERDEETGG
jgi:hypothetical protein